jgi:hypothetical protein
LTIASFINESQVANNQKLAKMINSLEIPQNNVY